MERRQFLKGVLFSTGGTMVTLGGFGTLTKLNPQTAVAAEKDSEKIVYSSCEMCRNQCPVAIHVN
ncbi:MAG: hypothetical protein QMC95_15285, partial [Desulfitobacteriaceae bacterium]|nr:hypothetical protein [Desulfitobacteriaceae bacterium]MDI6915555.1 hypothetical protein [Desulfitobacteriaceae bacterium]